MSERNKPEHGADEVWTDQPRLGAPEPGQRPGNPGTPRRGPVRRPVRMCVRCRSVTDTPTVVYEVHQNSGPGFNVYACGACAPLFPPPADILTVLPASRRNGSDE